MMADPKKSEAAKKAWVTIRKRRIAQAEFEARLAEIKNERRPESLAYPPGEVGHARVAPEEVPLNRRRGGIREKFMNMTGRHSSNYK